LKVGHGNVRGNVSDLLRLPINIHLTGAVDELEDVQSAIEAKSKNHEQLNYLLLKIGDANRWGAVDLAQDVERIGDEFLPC